jgi:large subunit ribosomal protein L9
MKVILQEDVHNLGAIGDVVDVADGYGRNFLLPRKLAVIADATNQHRLEHVKRVAAARQAKVVAEARELGTRLGATAISIKRQAASEDKIFGSVTNADIAEALLAQGIEIDKRTILLEEPIKNIGVFQVPVRIHKDVDASVKVYVIRG